MQSPPDVDVDPDGWHSITDRREKKRVQNRVAQRSYRLRVKQRLEELQAQVNEQQPPPHPAEVAGGGPDGRFAPGKDPGDPGGGGGEPTDRAATHANQHPSSATEGAAAPWLSSSVSSSGGDDSDASRRPSTHPALDPFFWAGHEVLLPADLGPAPPDGSGARISLEHMGDVVSYPSDASIRRALSSRGSGSGDASAVPSPLVASTGDPLLSELTMPVGYPLASPMRYSLAGSDAYEPATKHGLPPMSHALAPAWPPAAPASSGAAPPELDPAAPLETRLEHLVAMAKGLGFENFDALATAYYASALDPHSSARLDQRLSRNRWLPTVLAEIRQRSAGWTAWERRGYEEEIIRSAEAICRDEWRAGLTKHAERAGTPLSEVVLQDRLPHLWTFLSGLTANNDLVPPQHRQHAVFTSILLLSGLGGPASFMWSS